MAMSDFELIDASNIDDVSFDSEPNGELIRQLVAPWVRGGVDRYLDNGTGEARLARVGGRLIPILVNHGVADASGLCSPSAYYVGYARDFVIKTVRSHLLGGLARILLAIFSLLLENRKFNRVVYINHWFLPTAPPPRYEDEIIRTLVRELVRYYPDYALVLKGVGGADASGTTKTPPGFLPVYHRQVYYFDGHDKTAARKKSVRGTLGKLRRSKYRILRYSGNDSRDIQIDGRTDSDGLDRMQSCRKAEMLGSGTPERLRSLYRGLYIRKHSSLNPDYNTRWFSEVATQPALNTRVLERDGAIDAFGCILILKQAHSVAMIASVGGYAASPQPRKPSLYELLQGLMVKAAIDARAQLNLSSGADAFKRLRGARPAPEYEGIRISHLCLAVRWRWLLLMHVYNRVAPLVYRAV